MPFGARVFYDRQRRERLVANLDARFSKRRSRIHVSDLTTCIRQAAFGRFLTERSEKLDFTEPSPILTVGEHE